MGLEKRSEEVGPLRNQIYTMQSSTGGKEVNAAKSVLLPLASSSINLNTQVAALTL